MSAGPAGVELVGAAVPGAAEILTPEALALDRKSTRLNSSH